MSATSLHWLPRTIAFVLGLLGVVTFTGALCSFLGFVTIPSPSWVLATPMLVLVSVASFRAAYLTWFRWSPLAVRHIVGTAFFFITIWLITRWPRVDALAVLFACYASYYILAWLISGYLFPDSSHRPPSRHIGDTI